MSLSDKQKVHKRRRSWRGVPDHLVVVKQVDAIFAEQPR